MHKALATNNQGDLRATTGAFLTPTYLPFLILLLRPVEFPDEFNVVLHDAAEFSFGAPDEDELSIATSGDGLMPSNAEDSAGLPPSGAVAQHEFDAELVAMLDRAATSISWSGIFHTVPSVCGWMIGIWTPVPFFPEVHEEHL